MAEEVALLVRVPVSEVVKGLREKHKIRDPFDEVRIEADSLVFYFIRTGGALETAVTSQPSRSKASMEHVAVSVGMGKPKKRRSRRKRNRMKTRGWGVVGKITNNKGQTVTIYKPFVDELEGKGATKSEMRSIVARILRSNGNRPSESSVEYFLSNTLEYLKSKTEGAKAANAN